MRNASIDLSINHRGFDFFRSVVYSEVSKLYSWIRGSGCNRFFWVIGVANRGRGRCHNGRRNRFFIPGAMFFDVQGARCNRCCNRVRGNRYRGGID